MWLLFFNLSNIRYLLLLMSVIYAKGNEAVTNSGQTDVCLAIDGSLKILPRHFRHFHCSNFRMTFDKNFVKKSYHFLTSSKFLLYRKNLHSGNRQQLNDYPKYHLNNPQNLPKNVFFVSFIYVNCRYLKYLIFEVSRICANCRFDIANQSYISQPFTKSGPLKKLIPTLT